MSYSRAQELIEKWTGADPEMRHIEIMCGQNLRVCVRLYEIDIEASEDYQIKKCGEAEDWSLELALEAALVIAKARASLDVSQPPTQYHDITELEAQQVVESLNGIDRILAEDTENKGFDI